MTHRPDRMRLSALALVASMTALSPGCAISAMTPVPANHNVEKTPSCSTSSGSVGLDIVWGLIWGVPAIALFGEDEPGVGLLFALASGVHIASAVTGVKWAGKCTKARKQHDEWLAGQQDLLDHQRRANQRWARKQKAAAKAKADAKAMADEHSTPDDPKTPTAAATPSPANAAAAPPAASAPSPAAAPAPVTPIRAAAPVRVPSKPKTRRPRNHDPWAEFWREVAP